MNDLDQLTVTRISSCVDMEKLCAAVDQAVHLLLVSGLLSNNQQVGRDNFLRLLSCDNPLTNEILCNE